MSFDVTDDRLHVYFCVSDRSGELDEDVEDVIGDLEALLPAEITGVEFEVFVGEPGHLWAGHGLRMAFAAKPEW